MPRTYVPKDPSRKGAKLRPEVSSAIRWLYCRGKTQSEATAIIGRWARRKKLAPTSRQTVNKHYAEIGDRLFHLAYLETHASAWELICDECRDVYVSRDRELLYGDNEVFRDWRRKLRYHFGGHADYIDSIVRELSVFGDLDETSRRANGLPRKGFYIQWARAFWVKRYRERYPQDTRSVVTAVYQLAMSSPSLRKGSCCCHNPTSLEWRAYRSRRFPEICLAVCVVIIQDDEWSKKSVAGMWITDGTLARRFDLGKSFHPREMQYLGQSFMEAFMEIPMHEFDRARKSLNDDDEETLRWKGRRGRIEAEINRVSSDVEVSPVAPELLEGCFDGISLDLDALEPCSNGLVAQDK
jgi:hypothetical protein